MVTTAVNEAMSTLNGSCDSTTIQTMVTTAVNEAMSTLNEAISTLNKSCDSTTIQTMVTTAVDEAMSTLNEAISTLNGSCDSTTIQTMVTTAVNEAMSTLNGSCDSTTIQTMVTTAVNEAMSTLNESCPQGQPGSGTTSASNFNRVGSNTRIVDNFKGLASDITISFLDSAGPFPTLSGPSSSFRPVNGYIDTIRPENAQVHDLFSLEAGVIDSPEGGVQNATQFRLQGTIGPLQMSRNQNYQLFGTYFSIFCLDVSSLLSAYGENIIYTNFSGHGLMGLANTSIDPSTVNYSNPLPQINAFMSLDNVANPTMIYFVVCGNRDGSDTETTTAFNVNFSVSFIGINVIY